MRVSNHRPLNTFQRQHLRAHCSRRSCDAARLQYPSCMRSVPAHGIVPLRRVPRHCEGHARTFALLHRLPIWNPRPGLPLQHSGDLHSHALFFLSVRGGLMYHTVVWRHSSANDVHEADCVMRWNPVVRSVRGLLCTGVVFARGLRPLRLCRRYGTNGKLPFPMHLSFGKMSAIGGRQIIFLKI